MASKTAALAKLFDRGAPANNDVPPVPQPLPAAIAAADPEPVAEPHRTARAAPAPVKRKRKEKLSRAERVHVGGYLPVGFQRGIRMVQAQTGMTTQAIIADALNELFHKYKVPKVDYHD